ncbi:GNAT family N-acetyltransferase [Oryzifoliimicrobium ureilyticus]|uniref:GNAT family N-acetyltransferase n=1 Tax=Oryzifoliimicrobium ureilyticus TaxID=3113724 RepID=UPI0030765066
MHRTARLLTVGDPALESVASLMEEMQRHYNVACPPRAKLMKGLKDRPANAEMLIGEKHDRVIAFCAFTTVYPGPGLQAGIFLKELYVKQDCRGEGIGRHLMQELAEIAVQRGLARIDWTADANDLRLLSFYDGLGAARRPEKLFYRLDGDALSALIRD